MSEAADRREPTPLARVPAALVIAGLVSLVVWVVWRIGLFPLTGDAGLPRAFFSVDHPFHTARADLVRDAWAGLDTVRWVASHQGGYPAEFFPFGLPAVAAGLALLTGGTLAIESAWAIVIVAVFLLPGAAWLLMARLDRIGPAVALVALAGQVSIASDWTHGGYTELVEWGLATNVAGATWALVALPLLTGAVARRSPRLLALAALAIALCAVTNPRSLVAVAVTAVAVLVAALWHREARRAAGVVAAVAVLAAGLAAPVLLPLARYSDLYFFLSYQEYDALAEYRAATLDAVSWPVAALALLGVALALARRRHRASEVAALALVLYVGLTTLAVLVPGVRDLVPQLELPRLMPYQRLLTLWMAAYGIVEGIRLAVPLPARLAPWRDALVSLGAALVLVAVFATDRGPFPPPEQGLRDVPRVEGANAAELDDFRDAIAIADAAAEDHTGILVIGSRLSWHEQLWAPMEAPDRRYLYDDWLWYWHRLHDGPYDYRSGHFYPNPSEALDPAYLARHGIGVVVLTDKQDMATGASVRQTVARADHLQPVGTSGQWNVYAVAEPVPVATLGGAPPDALAVADGGERIEARFSADQAGTVLVRQNWFPRWQATVNGEPAQVERGEGGYMEVTVPAGTVELELRYAAIGADWVARAVSMLAAAAVLALLIAPTPIREWARR